MFQHQGDILKELNNNKWSKVQHLIQMLVAHTFIVNTKSLKTLKFQIPQVNKPKSVLMW